MNGGGSYTFSMEVQDCGEPGNHRAGGADYVRIFVNGQTAEGPINGNVTIH